MATQSPVTFKGLFSNSRILFSLLPGLGALIVLRMAIHLYRQDIEDIENRVKDKTLAELHDCYDFIIVGGGSAGAVLANRLSENPIWQILLIEAGPDENVLSEVPILFPVLQTSSIDWQFLTEPNDGYCLSMVDGKCKWPRGKVLGGSSVLNAMLYIRGNKKDYDNWALAGNDGWSYDEVLKYFLKSEDMRIPEYVNDSFHASGGPLTVENFAYEQPITKKILEAGEQLGYPIRDVNGEFQTGFTRSHGTVRDGLRCSTAKGFLRSVSHRTNLHVTLHSIVEKVLIDENKSAYGVKFTKHGQEQIVKASKEVILSAGSIQSPQLLMLSGIGDANHLKEIGIYPIVNLPGVGQNLQDHVAMGGHSFLFDNPYDNGTDYGFNLLSAMSLPSMVDFCVHKTGLYYSMMEAEAMAFINTKYQDPAEDYPDIQLFIAPTADNMDGGLFGKRANGLSDDAYAQLYEDIIFEPSFSVVPLLLRPKSRGYIKLRDSNPYSPPKIYPNYYSDSQDVKVMIEGARIVQQLVEQPALRELNARANPNRNPGCKNHELMSDEHLECQARHHTLTIYHPVGTCAMGPPGDPGAVVDPRLKIHGVTNLRVVDGSIMPTIVNGNTNAPIIMIAEKAADMIKEDWYEVESAQCPEQLSLYASKNSENDEAKTLAKDGTPDLFNETTSLFPDLKLSFTRKETKTNNAKTPEMKKSQTPKYSSRQKKVKPQYSYPYPYQNDYSYALQLQYMVPQFPYYGQGYQPKYPYLKSSQNRPYPYAKIKPTKLRPFTNWNNNHNINTPTLYKPFDNLHKQVYYETDEIITPRGQRKCRIWLYYNGEKYEVVL